MAESHSKVYRQVIVMAKKATAKKATTDKVAKKTTAVTSPAKAATAVKASTSTKKVTPVTSTAKTATGTATKVSGATKMATALKKVANKFTPIKVKTPTTGKVLPTTNLGKTTGTTNLGKKTTSKKTTSKKTAPLTPEQKKQTPKKTTTNLNSGKTTTTKKKTTNKKTTNKTTTNKTTTNKTTTNKTSTYNLAGKTTNAVNKVEKQYQGYEDAYNKQVDTQSKNDTAASNAQYDLSSAAAAQRNAVQKRELQKQLYRNGITGGASETSMMNAANNYASQQGRIASEKAGAANKIRQQANASKASFKLQNMQARDTAIQSAKDRVYNQYQNWLKRKDTKAQQKLENERYKADQKYRKERDKVADKRYAQATEKANQDAKYTRIANGYTSIKSIDKAIKKYKKSNPALVPFLKQRRGELAAANREYKYKYKALNK